jgi:phosphatidylserine/phosphatidylglycerophosphate/cardiolipin synthase-like enzyme
MSASLRNRSDRLLNLRLGRDPAARHLLIGLPVLTIAVLGIADWTVAAARRAKIEAAARAATEVVRQTPWDDATIQATILAAGAALPAMSVATPVHWCECAEVPIDCSAMCAGGIVRLVRLRASIPYRRMSPVGPTSISGQVTLRLP